ncbi:MAG TPA: tRNA (guanosine(37)-N1)-methyltransferase TrmD [Fibrobacteria bacterium]|nr:tRNA (guanosine(37)-N1)-methyltransferase TrmD [Fibrobacteria bacterium]
MRIDVITLFPEVFAALDASIPGRARASGALDLRTHQLREHAINKHGQVDDAPYGGEAGMVLRPEPLRDCLAAVLANSGGSESGPNENPTSKKTPKIPVFLMSAQGKLFDQKKALELAGLERFVVVCGHYKGVDQRFVDAYVDEEISIGDYVLSGGEAGALVVIDAVARLLPGVLGDRESGDTDSFARPGRLGWPVYTRPQEFEGREAPEVLLSGHHANIVAWRTLESLRLTRENRPDLLEHHPVTEVEEKLLNPKKKKKKAES